MTFGNAAIAARWPDYRTVWRWHFYAGLFCIPFVLWLATTGSLYLFKPQVEAWLDRPYDTLVISGPRATPAAQVDAALAAVPGSTLNAYEVPRSSAAAVRVLVGHESKLVRVYLHPQTLAVLRVVDEDDRLMQTISRLHGELMLGDRGSMLVELAASWAIVMLLSGLFLWWPRTQRGLGGVVYPRLSGGRRVFWRDLHAVTGFWVSFFTLFLLCSGLPWAKSWGTLLKEARSLGSAHTLQQDWHTGRGSELAARRAHNAAPFGDDHHHAAMPNGGAPRDYTALDRVLPTVQALDLAPPVLIAPPSRASAGWSARSDAQNRPLRANLTLDGASGLLVARTDFGQRPWLDRVIGIGVAAHEGQLFGWLNQALGVFTALGLIAVSLSALVLWWRRRDAGTLGAPRALEPLRASAWLVGAVGMLAIVLPLFGISLLAVLGVERLVLRRSAKIRRFLALRPA